MTGDEIRAFIFDLDGVITDTAEYHYLGWQRLADEEGIPFDREAGDALRGVARRDALMAILDGRPATDEQVEEMMDRKNRYYVELLAGIDQDAVLAGVLELIRQARGAGLRTAVGSASKNATTVLERLGIAELFDYVADGTTVTVHKPAPDLFLTVARQLGVSPTQAVVFEDATSGVEAALAGGFATVGLGPADRVGDADVVYADLADVTLERVLADLAAVRR
ncbi:MAG: beta-phosphoglucomutase [Candidatus Nanopelagicales bacterium]|jgi:kojibiose phosphorylase|nr:beta-phosphoglucomutase [Candidatus Nanopelagicales bacterium]